MESEAAHARNVQVLIKKINDERRRSAVLLFYVHLERFVGDFDVIGEIEMLELLIQPGLRKQDDNNLGALAKAPLTGGDHPAVLPTHR